MISFIHKWNEGAASYRYRAQIPARELGARLNDYSADILIYAKPVPEEVAEINRERMRHRIVVDVCDNHITREWFLSILRMADAVTCSTQELQKRLASFGFGATHIDDPYEFDEAEPHCSGDKVLWFGHASNIYSLEGKKILHPLRIVSNYPGTIPWSRERLLEEMGWADIVILPETSRFKSPNRAVESIRRGCFVVAEPHPALNEIPGIWLGDLEEGILWASTHQEEANQWTRVAQEYVSKKHSPANLSGAWKKICAELLGSTLVAGTSAGRDGRMSMEVTPVLI